MSNRNTHELGWMSCISSGLVVAQFEGGMAARAGGSGGPSNRCRVPPHATKSSNQPTAHIGRGASHDSDFSLSMKILTRLMEVLPRPRGGTVSIRCGIHGVDGHQGRFECRIKASVLLEMEWSVVCHHKAVAR